MATRRAPAERPLRPAPACVPSVRAATAADCEFLGLAGRTHSHLFVSDSGDRVAAAIALDDCPFETEMLRLRTAHVQDIVVKDRPESLAQIISGVMDEMRNRGYGFISCRRREDDIETLIALQSSGFHLVECLLTLERSLGADEVDMPTPIDRAAAADADGCAAIGGTAFQHDRFHSDPNISTVAANRLKAQWAANAVGGRADAVFVSRNNGRVIGFNACLLRGDTAIIDLIGVAPEQHGQGLGRSLVQAAIAYYAKRARRLVVGTQSRNYRSLALYQGQGFRVKDSAFTLHRHLSVA
jgi:ribosomal protein S18 acetylase RimI-like enzyme